MFRNKINTNITLKPEVSQIVFTDESAVSNLTNLLNFNLLIRCHFDMLVIAPPPFFWWCLKSVALWTVR